MIYCCDCQFINCTDRLPFVRDRLMTQPRLGYPNLGLGVGLRSVHYPYLLNEQPEVDWFEVISENYMDSQGRPQKVLAVIAERYPIVMHGVSMSIGSTDELDHEYLNKLKKLADKTNAHWISDHVCWTGVAGRNSHDLLPIPYTEETLQHLVSRIKIVQEVLERPLVLENPSSYVEFASSTMNEAEFLYHMTTEANCGLLLDVNNVYVSSINHGFDAKDYINNIPTERVVQIHLAGHTNLGTHIIDTHDGKVIQKVWELYQLAHARTGGVSTLLEWDAKIPDFPTVHAEVLKAKQFMHDNLVNDAFSTDDDAAIEMISSSTTVPQPATMVRVEAE